MQSYLINSQKNNKKNYIIYSLKNNNFKKCFFGESELKISTMVESHELIFNINFDSDFKPYFILTESQLENPDLNNQIENLNSFIDGYERTDDLIYELKKISKKISFAPIPVKISYEKNMNKFNSNLEYIKLLYINNQDTNNYKNDMFSYRSAIEMLGDQIIKIYKDERFDIPVNMDNLVNLDITMTNFTFANSLDLEVKLNMNLTLDWMKIPPTFSIKSNKILKDNILSVIEKLKPFSDTKSWSIKYSIYDTVVNIHSMINTYGEIEFQNSNNFEIMINELEYLFTIKLENISSVKLLELFDKNLVSDLSNTSPNQNSSNNKYVKEYWKKGTGYGHDQANNSWNIDEYVSNLNNKKNNIGKKIEKFINHILNEKNVLSKYKNQIIQIFTYYLNHDQIINNNIINIGNILMDNSKLFDIKEAGYIKLIKNIKDYLEENNIEHPIILGDINNNNNNINTIDINNINNINNVIKEMEISKLSEYQKMLYDYKFKFIDSEYKSFYYDNKNVSSSYNSDSAIVTNETITLEQIARLKKEFNILKKSITISEDASLFFTVDKSKIYKSRYIVTGPKDTPYSYGIFLFDMTINKNFPQKPPIAQFLNHGNKRFNPNLYDSGKLCLSLLGTWNTSNKGETWNPAISTFSQVLLSIQSLILIDEPYFNEPGHEKYIGTKSGIESSIRYNQNIRKYTLDHAINDLIEDIVLEKNNYKEFEYVIRNHFKFHANNIKQQNLKWYEEMPDSIKASFKTSMDKFEIYVAKL